MIREFLARTLSRNREPPAKEELANGADIGSVIDITNFPGNTLAFLSGEIAFRQKSFTELRRYARLDNHLKRYLNITEKYVLGKHGITMQTSKPRLQKRWRDWSKTAELTGSCNWRKLLALLLRTRIRDGEAYVQLTYDNGLKLNVLDVAAMQRTMGKEGIKYDEKGRPVEYYFRDRLKGIVPIPASEVIRIWQKEEPVQHHGRSMISSVIDELKRLREFEESHIRNAIVNALNGGFVKLPANMAALPSGANMETAAREIVNAEPGERGLLFDGMDWVPNNASFPSQGYNALRRGKLSDISSGLDISYWLLANDLAGANYSSLRHGWQADIAFFESMQEEMIDFCDQVFEIWNFGSDDTVIWGAPGFEAIDPAKEAQATERELKVGVTSASEKIRQKGGDPKKVLDERAKELEEYPHLNFNKPSTTATTEEENPEDNQDPDKEDKDERKESEESVNND